MRTRSPLLVMIFGILLWGPSAHSFTKSGQLRYLGPYDLVALLNQKFLNKYNSKKMDCLQITEKNKNIMGVLLPFSGRAQHSRPGPAFVNWYGNCLIELIDGLFREAENSHDPRLKFTAMFGKRFLNLYGENMPALWQELSMAQKRTIIEEWQLKLIGPPEVLKELGMVKDQDEFLKIILSSIMPEKNGKSVIEVTKHVIFLIAMRDEFLSY